MRTQLLVVAKAPVPGRVKTRLCPPATPEQAARIAAAALADTLDAVAATPAARRVLVLDGAGVPVPPGVTVLPQRGTGLADRLAHAYADSARPGTASLLIGMDTPQVDPGLLTAAIDRLSTVDAVLGAAEDGGWWALGLRDPAYGAALRGVPMSTDRTGARTADALRRTGLRVSDLPVLRDVDTAADARTVAAALGSRAGSRFAAAVTAELGVPAEVVA
ncbi:TIGR04282 family arsenosugar biosynthesis glycosyltransferase [Actinocatenispora rupis]|uniref:Glycosyl transferase n=1 Tax=Actinocatenispora rupis TaxID=519421 RepID=A0A8J3NCY1_9ACTN|nr:DUF2064 domain-containing protein [Actinocatenispora rupis]GID10934.1 glycosyl transferase [Actinocatenispora rupis]